PGLWIYRDWYAVNPEYSDLTVFDVYSDVNPVETTTPVADMESSPAQNTGTVNPLNNQPLPCTVGQFPNIANLNGYCLNNPSVRCDLFLLSWTLTPWTAVYPFSRLANKVMGYALATEHGNRNGFVFNLLYADYVQDSRATDIAVVRNGCLSPEM